MNSTEVCAKAPADPRSAPDRIRIIFLILPSLCETIDPAPPSRFNDNPASSVNGMLMIARSGRLPQKNDVVKGGDELRGQYFKMKMPG